MQTTSSAPAAGSARLFVALWPDADVRARLAAQRDALRLPPGSRAVVDANLHATLHFIGAFERAGVEALWTALSEVALEPVALGAHALAVWQRGTVVLQLHGDAALGTLHASTGAALRACGVTLDTRPFTPHVTLARAAASIELPPAPIALHWQATGFALVESIAGAVPTYRLLAAR